MSKTTVHRNTTCPFCGILCSDVAVKVTQLGVEADKNLPLACQQHYLTASMKAPQEPRVAGKVTSLDKALTHAVAILNKSRQPLFSGLISDVNTNRAVMQLARQKNGVIDHVNSRSSACETRVAQDYGWIAGSLSEAANRADLFVILGDETLETHPRFIERILTKRPHGDKDAPRFAFIRSNNHVPDAIKTYPHDTVQLAGKSFADIIRHLNLLSLDHPKTHQLTDSASQQIGKLYQSILASQYSCIIWNGSVFDGPHDDIAAFSLARFVKAINRTTRCISLPLGSNFGENTLHNVTLWQNGSPACASFSTSQGAHHDALAFNTSRMLSKQQCDSLFWVATLTPTPPPKTNLPTVFIGHHATSFEREPEVFIPTGIPGIDHPGHLFRVDNVVVMRLAKIRDGGLINAADVLQQMSQSLA